MYAQNIIEVREFRYDAQKRLLSILDRWFATDLDPSVKEGVKLTFKLLNKYIDNFYSPFNSEMKRASNMSKACEYLIASALKTEKKPKTWDEL